MEIIRNGQNELEVKLTPQDVESAIRQFICICQPELSKGWTLNADSIIPELKFKGIS